MKMLVVCAYGLYQNFRSSFIHAQIREFVKAGHQVCVLVPLALGKRDWDGKRIGAAARCEDGATIFPVRYISLSKYGRWGFNTWSALLSLWCAIHFAGKEMFCPDVVHAHTLGFSSTLGVWLKRRFQCPLIVTTHGSDTSIPAAQGKWRKLKQWSDATDCVVAVSTSLAKKVQASGSQTPVTVILNGYNLENLRKASGGSKEPMSIIYVGHLIQQKQVHITIQAFAQVHQRYPEATLTIVGSGPETAGLRKPLQRIECEQCCTLFGRSPQLSGIRTVGKMPILCDAQCPRRLWNCLFGSDGVWMPNHRYGRGRNCGPHQVGI